MKKKPFLSTPQYPNSLCYFLGKHLCSYLSLDLKLHNWYCHSADLQSFSSVRPTNCFFKNKSLFETFHLCYFQFIIFWLIVLQRRGFLSSFFVLGRVLRHFVNVLLQNHKNLKQNVAEMSQDRTCPRTKKLDTKSVFQT